MSRAINAAIAIAGLSGALWPMLAAARHHQPRFVAAARFGLITTGAPRMGPQVVKRGGFTAITDMVRPRFVAGMIDIYPSGASGFRLSIGDRYFNRTGFWSTAEQATRGLLYDPHWRGAGGVPSGIRRKVPALTAGYDMELASGFVLGLEGGALKGRAINAGPRGQAFRPEDRRAGRAGLNPIATLAIRWAF